MSQDRGKILDCGFAWCVDVESVDQIHAGVVIVTKTVAATGLFAGEKEFPLMKLRNDLADVFHVEQHSMLREINGVAGIAFDVAFLTVHGISFVRNQMRQVVPHAPIGQPVEFFG